MIERWLYKGIVEGQKKGEKFFTYLCQDGKDRFYSKELAPCQPGWFIEVDVTYTENGTITVHNTGRCKILDQHPDKAFRIQLQAESHAAEINLQNKKYALQKEYMNQLEPLRKAYWKTNTAGKAKLLAEFMEYITRP
jgi:hypothetical protein